MDDSDESGSLVLSEPRIDRLDPFQGILVVAATTNSSNSHLDLLLPSYEEPNMANISAPV